MGALSPRAYQVREFGPDFVGIGREAATYFLRRHMALKQKQNKLVRLAYKHLGKPYKYGAKPSEAPKRFDCSSFVQYLYRHVGVKLPRVALDQASQGRKVDDLKNLQIGDLIFIKGGWGHYNPDFPEGIGHVAIYVGEGRIVNARGESEKVIKEDVQDLLNRPDFQIVKRVL